MKVENTQKLGLEAAGEKLNIKGCSEEELHGKVEDKLEAIKHKM